MLQDGRLHTQTSLLTSTSLFKGLSPDALAQVIDHAHFHHYNRHDYLFQQGETAVRFYVILKGQVQLSQITPEGKQVIIHILGPGEEVAIIVVFGNTAYPLTAQALSDCEALSWDSDTINWLMEKNAKLAINGLKMLTGRFFDLQNRYRELATQRVERRIAHALLRVAEKNGREVKDGLLLDLPLTQQAIAEMSGTTLYTVNRTCSLWESKGIINKGRESFVICHYSALADIAENN